MLEVDARLTSDGVPVAVHDATLDRTTACTGEVRRIDLAGFRACAVDVLGTGGTLVPAPDPVAPATIADVLAYARDAGASVNLEIKNVPTESGFDGGRAYADRVMDVVLASGLPRERLIVQSFWPANLDVAAERLPGVQTALLTVAALNRGGPMTADARGYDWVSPAWPVDAAYVADARARGLRVVPYTLDGEADLAAASGLGVDAVITNDPPLARRVLGIAGPAPAPGAVPATEGPAPALRAVRARRRTVLGRGHLPIALAVPARSRVRVVVTGTRAGRVGTIVAARTVRVGPRGLIGMRVPLTRDGRRFLRARRVARLAIRVTVARPGAPGRVLRATTRLR